MIFYFIIKFALGHLRFQMERVNIIELFSVVSPPISHDFIDFSF